MAQTKHFGWSEKHSSPVLKYDEIIQEFRNIEGEGQPKNCETIAGKKDVWRETKMQNQAYLVPVWGEHRFSLCFY